MSDYIKREDVLKLAEKGYIVGNSNFKSVTKFINDIPAADVVERELYELALSDVVRLSVERKTGKWIDEALCSTSSYGVYHVNRCSVCRSAEPMLSRKNYCPNCGARMVTDDV